MSAPGGVGANTSHGEAATASTSEKSEMSTRFSGPQREDGRTPGRLEGPHAASKTGKNPSVATIQHLRVVFLTPLPALQAPREPEVGPVSRLATRARCRAARRAHRRGGDCGAATVARPASA